MANIVYPMEIHDFVRSKVLLLVKLRCQYFFRVTRLLIVLCWLNSAIIIMFKPYYCKVLSKSVKYFLRE